MKITLLLTQDLSSPSGLGRYLPWAKALVKLGYAVRVIALHPDFSNLRERQVEIEGVKVVYVAQMHVRKRGNLKTYFSPWKLVWVVAAGTLKLTAAALRNPGDVILIGKPHPMNSAAAWIARLFHPRVKLILDCDDFESGSNRFQADWQQKMLAWFEDSMPFRVQQVTSNTFFNIHRLEKLGISGGKLVYVPNGVDVDRFVPPEPDEIHHLRSELKLVGKKVITYIGSMSLTNHAVELLMRAFAIVRMSAPDARLLLVGAGEDLEKLQDLARELKIEPEVIFAGRVPPYLISRYYALSTLTVDPVHDDDAARGRCPLKMFESWACGIPFVTASVGDRETLSGDPPAAWLAKPGDERSLADGLLTLLADPALREQLKEAGLARVEQFTWEVITARTEKVFSPAHSESQE